MRVGTLPNTFVVVPNILYDLREEIPNLKKLNWLVEHAPAILFYMAANFLHLTELEKNNDNLQDFFDKLFVRHINDIREAGANHLQRSLDLVSLLPSFKEWWRKKNSYLESLKAEGMDYSDHLPQFGGLNLDTFLPGVASGAVMDVLNIHEFSRGLDPSYVLHLGGERFYRYLSVIDNPDVQMEIGKFFDVQTIRGKLKMAAAMPFIKQTLQFVRDFTMEAVVDINTIQALRKLRETIPPNRIGIENLEYTDFDAVMGPILKEIPDAGVWLDTGHLMIQKWHKNKRCFEEFCEKYWRNLIGVHIHNVVEISRNIYDADAFIKYCEEQFRKRNAPAEIAAVLREALDKKSIAVLQDHKPLDVEGGLLPLEKVLRLTRDIEKKTGREIPVVVELYYHDPLPSVRLLKKTINELGLA